MKRTIYLFALFAIQLSVAAQGGSLDPSFNANGTLIFDINNSNDVMSSILVQDDNKIVLIGYSNDKVALSRLNPNGSQDQSFGSNGIATTTLPYSCSASGGALQDDGKIIAAGFTFDGVNQVFLTLRYNPDGSLDTSFGNSGFVYTTFLNTNSIGAKVIIQDDGKIIVGGIVRNSPLDGTAFALVRYEQDGSLDNSFGIGGKVVTDISPGTGLGSLESLRGLTLKPNGKILSVGVAGPDAAIVQYNSDGSLDTSFGNGGIVAQNFSVSGNSVFNGVDVSPNGDIVTAGFYTSTNGFQDHFVAQYLSDGTIDMAFGNSGIASTPISSGHDSAAEVIVQPDGRIVVGAISANLIRRFSVLRYDENGSPDPSFGSNGVVHTILNPDDNILNALAIQPDGAILAAGVVGLSPADVGVARYTSGVSTIPEHPSPIHQISVQPNPAVNELEVELTPNGADHLRLELLDAQGRVLLTKQLTQLEPGKSQKISIDLSHFLSGTYFLAVGDNNVIQHHSIVKL